MNLLDILTAFIPFVGIGIWLVMLTASEKAARRQLGEEVVEIRLYRRAGYILQQVMTVLGIALPIAVAVFGIIYNIDGEELFIEIARSLLIASAAFGLRKSSLLMIGTRGFAFGPQKIVTWDRVEGIAWDRDIGQRLWGLTFTVRENKFRKKTVKLRLFVRRDLKENVEHNLERFHAAAINTELPARNVVEEDSSRTVSSAS